VRFISASGLYYRLSLRRSQKLVSSKKNAVPLPGFAVEINSRGLVLATREGRKLELEADAARQPDPDNFCENQPFPIRGSIVFYSVLFR